MNITDERDIQADGERLASYLEEKARLPEERRKLDAERGELEKVGQKFVQSSAKPRISRAEEACDPMN